MTETTIAGRGTDKPDRFEEELIAGLAISRGGLKRSFELADSMTRSAAHEKWDTFDQLRAHRHAVVDAIEIMKAMAEVTLSAAKLRGEFNQTYDVTHRTEGEPAKKRAKKKQGEGVAES